MLRGAKSNEQEENQHLEKKKRKKKKQKRTRAFSQLSLDQIDLFRSL
jgi:hypothetical protein